MTASSKTASGSGSKRARGANKPKVGKYTLAQQLGKDGYGEIHIGVPKAEPHDQAALRDATLTRDEDAVAQLKREAEAVQRLDHPNIVRLREVGTSRNRYFIAMELVRGSTSSR